jgi:PAS domain S-box-containing protein
MKNLVSIGHPRHSISWVQVWTASLLAPLVVAVVNVFLGQHGIVDVTIGHIHGHLHPDSALILYVITGLFMQRIVSNSSRRRRDAFQRSLIVAECNHHIRNALQSITNTAFLNGYKEIDAAVTRIESTLTDILPRLQVSGYAQLLDDATINEALLLSGNETQLNCLYDNVSTGIVRLSLDGHILRVNQAMCTMLGYTPQEFCRKTCEEISEATDYANESTLISDLFGRKLNQYSCNKRYIHKAGYPVGVNIFSTLVSTGGQTFRMLIVDKRNETIGTAQPHS